MLGHISYWLESSVARGCAPKREAGDTHADKSFVQAVQVASVIISMRNAI